MSAFIRRRRGFLGGFVCGRAIEEGSVSKFILRPMMGMMGRWMADGTILPSPTMTRRVSGSSLENSAISSVQQG
jgi:hypothetical protein